MERKWWTLLAVSAATFNVLTLGALLSFAGAILALWLVREHEIERQPVEEPIELARPPDRELAAK